MVLLVVAPALSQTDGSTNDNDGIIDNISDMLDGVDDEGDDTDVDTDLDTDLDTDEGYDTDEGDDTDESDATPTRATRPQTPYERPQTTAENNRNSGGDDHDKDNRDKDNQGSSGDRDGDNDGEGIEITNSREQNADSGDLDQTVSITGPGDNASQCLGIQPVGNTDNAQNQVSVQPGGDNVDDGSRDEDRKRDRNGDGKFTVEDLNTTIDVSPTSTVTCNQPINQAASASGDSVG